MILNKKPIIGFSCGDINGIGPEIIIKTLSDNRILEHCVPVIFGSSKVMNYYRKIMGEQHFSFFQTKDIDTINHKQINIINCWDEEINITPGVLNDVGGKYAVIALNAAVQALKNKAIDALVTAPIHKSNVLSDAFKHTGHTPYLQEAFGADDVLMMMCSDVMKVALVTEHVPIHEVAQNITKDKIIGKLRLLNKTLQRDFDIQRPKIAVLALNPHSGDGGLIGNEEKEIIIPAVRVIREEGILAFGTFSADAFFAQAYYKQFDAVLAMYHDQGLIPFKSISDGGVNFTAGLSVVRTSPDHGVAFDIAGKNTADSSPTLQSLFLSIDILKNRFEYDDCRSNPMKRKTKDVIGRVVDEAIEE